MSLPKGGLKPAPQCATLLLFLLCTIADARPPVGDAFERHASRHFELWTDMGEDTARFYLDQFESTLDRFYDAARNAGFDAARPSKPLVAVLFDDRAQFRKYLEKTEGVRAAWSAGHFSARTRIVALCHESDIGDPAKAGHAAVALRLTLHKARHEVAHQLFDASGILPADRDAPDWLAEGLAMLFEEPGGPEKPNAHRMRSLQLAEEAGRTLNLRDLLTAGPADEDAPERVAEFYARAWLLTHHVWNRRPGALQAYLEEVRSGTKADPVRRFEKHFGADLGRLEQEIDAHRARLRA